MTNKKRKTIIWIKNIKHNIKYGQSACLILSFETHDFVLRTTLCYLINYTTNYSDEKYPNDEQI